RLVGQARSVETVRDRGRAKRRPAGRGRPAGRILCTEWGSVRARRVDLLEQPLQLGPAAVDAALHGAHREACDLRDLLVSELLHVAKDDDLAELLGDLLERILDVAVLDRALGVGVRRERLVRDLDLVLLVVAVDGLEGVEAAALPLPVLAPGQVAGDGVEPGRELRD